VWIEDESRKTAQNVQKVHDVVANAYIAIMTEIEHRASVDKSSYWINRVLYKQSRDISYNKPVALVTISHNGKQLLMPFGNRIPSTNYRERINSRTSPGEVKRNWSQSLN